MTKLGHGLAFGTYRLNGEAAARVVTGALEAGVRGVDTAELYENEASVFDTVRTFESSHPELGPVRVTTKVFKNLLFDQTIRAVERSAERLGRPLDVVLLHRPLPAIMWRALSACVDRGLAKEIGVSNYSAAHLRALLQLCEGIRGGTACRRPSVNQVEFHPFVGPVQPLLCLCASEGIRVEGHTVLARGQHFDVAPLARLSDRLGVSPAVVMLRWVQELGVDVVFHTSNQIHLREVVEATRLERPRLGAREMAEISGYYGIKTVRFFPIADVPEIDDELAAMVDTAEYVNAVAARLDEDRSALNAGLPVSKTALNLPSSTHRQLLTDPVANRLALRLFPIEPGANETASYDRFRELVRKLRAAANAQREGSPKAKKLSCAVDPRRFAPRPRRFVKGEPVSMAVVHPVAMPVEVSPAEELAPFFDFLRDPEKLGAMPDEGQGPLMFKRGAYFADARMDLCKQVVGPDHIGALCDAVEQPFAHHRSPKWGRVRHFLLGNNIACDGDSTVGARALARLMSNPSVEIETWYLAGNSIGPEDMAVLGRALESNVHARALWLKRNPLGTDGAAHLGRLLGKNRSLRLLDVHNTGLFDDGIEALAHAFEEVDGQLHLRHLYAAANALSERSLDALRPVLTTELPRPSSLVSLSLSLNRFGNRGCEVFVDLVETGALAGLLRLDLGSIGLERPDLSRLGRALSEHCPKLRSLDLGTYLSTRDMGEKQNRLHPDVSPLVRLLGEHPALELLDVSLCDLPPEALGRLVDSLGPRQSLHGAGGHAFRHSERERRFLKHPRRVVHIDSIYRGR
jgi:diketogulonate reductase-like aldo/keto reductase